MKALIVLMFVSILSVFSAIAHGSTLRPGTYYVDQAEGHTASMTNVRTLTTRTVHVSYTVRESAYVMVLAPVVLTGKVTAPVVASVIGVAYKHVGTVTRYVGGQVEIAGEIGAHDDVTSVDPEHVAMRCESVGPRLDGTFVTICDGLVISVDDGRTAHMMPFGAVAGNEQIGGR